MKLFGPGQILLTLLTLSMCLGSDALAQEQTGTLNLNPADPGQIRALMQALQRASDNLAFSEIADAPDKWIAPRLKRRTSLDKKYTATILKQGLSITENSTGNTIKNIKIEKSTRNPFLANRVCDISWSPDSKKLLYTASNGAHILDMLTLQIADISNLDFPASCCGWSPVGNLLAMMTATDPFVKLKTELQILDSNTKKIVYRSPVEGNDFLAWSPNGKLLAVNGVKGNQHLIEVENNFRKLTVKNSRSGVFAFSPDSKYIAIADPFAYITIFSTQTLKPIQKATRPGVSNLAWSKDGTSLLTEAREAPLPIVQEPLKMTPDGKSLQIEIVAPPKPGELDYMPSDIDECYVHLDKLLPRALKSKIMEMVVPSDVIQLHIGMGTYLRNSLGLWSGSSFSDYINNHTKEREPETISSALLRGYWYHLRGENYDLFAALDKGLYKERGMSLEKPMSGVQLDQRRVVYSGLSKIKEDHVNVDDYIERFNKVEAMVAKGDPESSISDQLENVRIAYSKNIARAGKLNDQFYGDGPLSKLCRALEVKLRANWKEKSFADDVWVFAHVTPDGTIINVETDDPKRYGSKICTAVEKCFAGVKLEQTLSEFAIPLVVTLNQQPTKTQVYVRHLNFSPYWYVFESKVRKFWVESNLGHDGQVEVKMKIYRDGTIKDLVIVKGTGDAEFDKKVIEVFAKSPSFGHFPDGSHEFSDSERTWGYSFRNINSN